MEISVHGFDRIRGRTAMLPRDVLSIVAGNAVVHLGAAEGYDFLLFHSPPDANSKIAIVSADHAVLVSIWEKDFALPIGILKVTPKLEFNARLKLRDFIFENIKKKSGKLDKELSVQLEVKLKPFRSKIEYRKVLGTVNRSDVLGSRNPWIVLAPLVREIAEIVEDKGLPKLRPDDTVYYQFWFFKPGTRKILGNHLISHEGLMEYIKSREL